MRLAPGFNCAVHVREVDIARSSADDLSGDSLWEQFFSEVAEGLWDCVFLSPPCNTFSRARHLWKKSPGPRPIRSKQYPYGFPWVSNANKLTLKQHNFFILQCKRMAKTAYKSGKFYLWEHPEDLGRVKDTDDVPGSIWQWEELQTLLKETEAITWAIYQCHFGAGSPKPTRLLGNIGKDLPHSGWPIFDAQGFYLGPLPGGCGHKFHVLKLIGKSNGIWKTSPSAAYPSKMCRYLAELLLSRFVRGPTVLDKLQSETESSDISICSEGHGGMEPIEDVDSGVAPPIEAVEDTPAFTPVRSGQPIATDWDLKRTALVDGLGLCSPNRWWPSDRFQFEQDTAQKFAEQLHLIILQFVNENLKDLRRSAFELAVGRMTASPFVKERLDGVRKLWAQLLPRPEKALVKPERQPFWLELMSQSLQILGDPDWKILTEEPESFATGVPVGYESPLPRVPAVFPPKEKNKRLDDFIFMEDSSNYKSADALSGKLEEKFREEEKLGRMYPSTLGALRQQFGDQQILIAPMGALEKPDGGVRPLHDATHHVQVNNAIPSRDQLEYPGPGDAAALVECSRLTQESCFAISADIQAAHRLVLIRRQDWRLLACRAHSESPVVWVNCVGIFGVSSASYWWTRLFGLVGRLVTSVLRRRPNLQIVYVDDLHILVWGPHKFLWLWMMIAAYEILGTPFGYHKFKGGLEIPFGGYELDYYGKTIGISVKRAQWLKEFMLELERKRYTLPMRDFNEFLGRLGFVARILTWIKPHLAPLYSWSAALDRGKLSCARPVRALEEEFRTDAKCEQGRVVLAGHHMTSGQWFSFEVFPIHAPYLFDQNGNSSWASASAELLATLAALQFFGYFQDMGGRRIVPIVVAAGTDNQANEALAKKRSSTAWPLMLVNMQLSHHLFRASLQLTLRWRPRDENQDADDLTNGKFENFDLGKRLDRKFEDLSLALLGLLWDARSDFLDRAALKVWPVPEQVEAGFEVKAKW
eukprot:s851_g23.t1